MNKFYIGVIVFSILFSACKSSNPAIKFSNTYLDGNWMVIAMYESDKKLEKLNPLSVTRVKTENEVLSIYHFKKDNTFILDTGSTAIINGTYKIEDTTINLKKENLGSKFFTATRLTDSTMFMVTDFPNEVKGKLVYEFVKIKAKPNFDIADNNWKKPIPAASSDDSIRRKLIEILKHYEGYYATLNESGALVFSQDKLCLPLKLYSGGVGTRPLAETKGFNEIMGSPENAEKAYKMLKECFGKLPDYPDRGGNFVLEYAIVFSQFAKQLSKYL